MASYQWNTFTLNSHTINFAEYRKRQKAITVHKHVERVMILILEKWKRGFDLFICKRVALDTNYEVMLHL